MGKALDRYFPYRISAFVDILEIFDKDFKNLMCGTMNNLDFNINLRADLNSVRNDTLLSFT